MKKMLSKVGQSTLEYVIVFTAIVAAIIIAISQVIKPTVNKMYSDATSAMNASSTYFSNSAGGGIGLGSSGAPGGGAPGGGIFT